MTGTTSCATEVPPVPIQTSTLLSPASRMAAARFSSGDPKLTPSTVTGAARSNALAELLTKKLIRSRPLPMVKRNARPPPPFGKSSATPARNPPVAASGTGGALSSRPKCWKGFDAFPLWLNRTTRSVTSLASSRRSPWPVTQLPLTSRHWLVGSPCDCACRQVDLPPMIWAPVSAAQSAVSYV